jgi:hypothetical protein
MPFCYLSTLFNFFLKNQYSTFMKKVILSLLLGFTAFSAFTQTEERITIISATPSEATGQDYSSWLSDDLNNLVPNAWTGNSKWVDVTLKLEKKALISRLSFYDYEGVFTDKPAYIYVLNGTQKIFLGLFEGLTYKTFVDLKLTQPLVGDAILVHKFGNNIPQKIKVFGQAITATTVIPVVEDRIKLLSISASENTGQDYTPWLNDDLNSMVANAWTGNSKWVDVTVKLAQKALINKISLYDFEGVFTDYPALIYAQNGTQKTLLATFDGSTYKTWVSYKPGQSVLADAIVVHKFSNNIPQKINVYGQAVLTDPLDVPAAPAEERVKITAATPSENTGQNYTPWLNDDLNSLVANVWTGNSKWVDVTLTFEKRSKITRLSFYDYEGVFTTNPASIYALDGTTKIFLGVFEGLTYKTFVDLKLAQPLVADAIIVHKFGNNIPQKVQVYGQAVSTTTGEPPVTTPPNPAVVGTKIPIDAKRWYQLNTVDNGLEGLFDGITDVSVETGWGKILSNYDAYYPLLSDEEMTLQSIKFYDWQGIIKDTPLTLSVITDQWQRIPVASFTGETYNQWVGPNPANNGKFTLDTLPSGKIRYLVINSSGSFPTEIELYGTYKASVKPVTLAPKREVKLKNGFGVNAFEWNFLGNTGDVIEEAKIKPIKTFSGFRHYMDWDKIEHTEGSYTYNPTNSGGWNYDAVYERCKTEGIEVLACLQTIPPWLIATYPAADQDYDNVPVRYGKSFSAPSSYIEQAKAGFQYVARYGNNTLVNPALLSVNSKQRWTGDGINTLKIGLGLVKYIECGNERDKWWKGRKGYQTAREYAANLSAFYDGHKNTMGAGVGVKNADPAIKVVMTGLASASTDYVRGMIDWCKEFRGYNADGSVNICWDVINYHYYSNNSNASQNGIATRGTAPEVSNAGKVADDFVQLAHRELNDMPVWVTELGYDANQGSPYKAIPIGTKSEYITQADWSLRSALMYNRLGIDRGFFYELYDDNFPNPTQFASSGLINEDKTRKPVADYFYQTSQLFGEYVYKETLSKDPSVDRYELNGQSVYALYVPDETGRTVNYTLSMGNFNQANVYSPKVGSDTMNVVKMTANLGKLSLTLTETPVFVIPSNGAARLAVAETTSELFSSLLVYPNPASDFISFSLDNDHTGSLEVKLFDVNATQVVKQNHFLKTGKSFVGKIDIRSLPFGMYIMELTQDNEKTTRKILKTE